MGGFVVAIAKGPAGAPSLTQVMTAASKGWQAERTEEGWLVLRRGRPPPQLLRRRCGVMVLGDLFEGAVPRPSGSAPSVFNQLLAEGWGSYVALASTPAGLEVLRDPSGGVEAIIWAADGLTFVASELPDWIDPWLPESLAIDAAAVAEILSGIPGASWRSPLTGLTALAPGAMWCAGQVFQAWRPADHLPRRHGVRRELGRTLVETVDATVAAQHRGPVVVEISGGLDSAIVASALVEVGAEVALGVNYYVRQSEGDERPYARAVAAGLGLPLVEIEKPELPLDVAALREVSQGFRPALDGVDPHHDMDLAERCAALGARSLFTGRGGDSQFFQTPTSLIAADMLQAGEPIGQFADLARWLGRTVYGLAAQGLRQTLFASDRAPSHHPWLDGPHGTPPAKRLQVASLIGAVAAQSPTRRGEVAALRHPLLAQPVMEACLGISVPDLVIGGRDRGLARMAFANRVPLEVLNRRAKGRLSAHYGRTIARSLDLIRPLLIDGRLADGGWIDRRTWGELLTLEQLIWRGGAGQILNALMIELWLEAWTERIRTRLAIRTKRPRQLTPKLVRRRR